MGAKIVGVRYGWLTDWSLGDDDVRLERLAGADQTLCGHTERVAVSLGQVTCDITTGWAGRCPQLPPESRPRVQDLDDVDGDGAAAVAAGAAPVQRQAAALDVVHLQRTDGLGGGLWKSHKITQG